MIARSAEARAALAATGGLPAPPVRVLEPRSTALQGGGPESALLLAAALARSVGVDETLCFLRRRGAAELAAHRQALAAGVASVVVEERRAVEPATLGRLCRLVREPSIQIVHGHDDKADLLGFLLARAERVVAVATAHGWPQRTRRERWLYDPADRRLPARFAHVYAASPDLRDRLLAAGAPPDAVEVLAKSGRRRAVPARSGGAGARAARMVPRR